MNEIKQHFETIGRWWPQRSGWYRIAGALLVLLLSLQTISANDRHAGQRMRSLSVLYREKYDEILHWYPQYRELVESRLRQEGPAALENMSGYLGGRLPAAVISWENWREMILLAGIFSGWIWAEFQIMDSTELKSKLSPINYEIREIADKIISINSLRGSFMCARNDPAVWSKVLQENKHINFISNEPLPQNDRRFYVPDEKKEFCLYDAMEFYRYFDTFRRKFTTRPVPAGNVAEAAWLKTYNASILHVIEEDQVVWNYSYEGYSSISSSFWVAYVLDFFQFNSREQPFLDAA